MSAQLERSFAALAPFLFGETDVAALEGQLGASPSGSDNLDFYRVLVARNINKILSELFPLLCGLIKREHPELWPQLVQGYTRAHPSDARDPNRFGLEFPEYLATRRAAQQEYGALYEELADYQMCRYLAASAPTDAPGDDGFEQRVFIRGYTHPVVDIVKLLRNDPNAQLPAPRPVTLIVYRSLHPPKRLAWSGLRSHAPDLEEIAALAKRQGLTLAGPLAQLDPQALARGLARLVERGVLAAREAK